MAGHQHQPADQPAPRPSWVTQADRAAWQRQASAELAAILTAHPDLPAITWTITPGGGLTGQALVPGDPRGSRELFNAWLKALELCDQRETPMGDGASYVRAHATRGTTRVTLTAVVGRMDAVDNRGRRNPRLVQTPEADRPSVNETLASLWERPVPPPGPPGPYPG